MRKPDRLVFKGVSIQVGFKCYTVNVSGFKDALNSISVSNSACVLEIERRGRGVMKLEERSTPNVQHYYRTEILPTF